MIDERRSRTDISNWSSSNPVTPVFKYPSAIVYCDHCCDNFPIKDPDKGYICCGTCGKVLDDTVFSDEPNFYKDGKGESRIARRVCESIESVYSISRQRTLDKVQIALDRSFTMGRRTTHVAAACLYIACRQSKKAYLLIDFSDYLQINVYVLGAVFLQLCQVLLLSEHPFIQKLIDPSLFIHRFTERLLFPRRDKAVSDTALRIVASMKRDWMQTGRKPSGLCGAALYIAALSHGYNYTKADIVSVVHVCEATLMKRLIEFENTDSGSLTIEEFLATADEYSQEPVSKRSPMSAEMLCKHKGKDFEHFAHGLCEKCYNKFIKLSGGLEGGADPPAFQRAEKQRFEAAKRAEEAAAVKEAAVEQSLCDTQNSDVENITPREVIATVQRNAHTMELTRSDRRNARASTTTSTTTPTSTPPSRRRCCPTAPHLAAPASLAPLDTMTPTAFDNAYYTKLLSQRGLLHSYQELFNNGSADSTVSNFASNAAAFTSAFATAMVKMGNLSPLTGSQGQIRVNCWRVNSL
ncbi:transcription factor IIIB 70 kDa subunit-like [Miscanthus floridulus]|uniref:transcription factor IIIB 70 kDa subunit-like n=1 Tax=Miscanthus floridulus TaxID=154761 RepID=UPI003457A444